MANAYATSVGSRALTVKQACFLATIFEFAGAISGSAVADTIRKGIADYKCFESGPDILMFGNFCVVIAVGIWLLLASYLEMPVSTTHSCVGGMIGMTIVAHGGSCVVWTQEGDEDNLYLPKGVTAIVLSWVFSPVLSAIFAVILFWLTRQFVLRSKDSFNRAALFYPVLVFLAVFINVFYLVSKGVSKKICTKDNTCTKDAGCPGLDTFFMCRNVSGKAKVDAFVALGLSAGIGLGVGILMIPVAQWLKRKVKAEYEGKQSAGANSMESGGAVSSAPPSPPASPPAGKSEEAAEPATMGGKAWAWTKKATMTSLNADPHASVEQSETVKAIHANAEKFDPMTEDYFKFIQIFTAICDSYAHGANDVANAMAPFMAVWSIYHSNGVVGKSSSKDYEDDGFWILALGGIFIGIGLLLYGYKIIRAIGVKLAVITPSRGYAIELGAAIVIIAGSFLGLPLSTTHCQVGATTGVALLEGGKGVNKWVLGKTIVGWVITLIVVGFSCGLIVAFGIQAPLAMGARSALINDLGPGWCCSNPFSFDPSYCWSHETYPYTNSPCQTTKFFGPLTTWDPPPSPPPSPPMPPPSPMAPPAPTTTAPTAAPTAVGSPAPPPSPPAKPTWYKHTVTYSV